MVDLSFSSATFFAHPSRKRRRLLPFPAARLIFPRPLFPSPASGHHRFKACFIASSTRSKQSARVALLAADDEGRLGGLFEHLADALFGFGGAFEVGDGADGIGHSLALVGFERRLVHLLQLPFGVVVVPQILLVAHEDDGHVGAEMPHFRRPLLRDILQAVGRIDGEAHQDHVRVRVRKRSQTIVVFLTSRVPQRQFDLEWGEGGGVNRLRK